MQSRAFGCEISYNYALKQFKKNLIFSTAQFLWFGHSLELNQNQFIRNYGSSNLEKEHQMKK